MIWKEKKPALIAAILITIGILGLGYYFVSQKALESTYQTALTLVEQGKWAEARQLFEELPAYKDSPSLQKYTYAKDTMAKSKIRFEPNALSAMQSIPEGYSGEFAADIKLYTKSLTKQKEDIDAQMKAITDEQIKHQQEQLEKDKQDYVNYFNQGKYHEASIIAVLKRNNHEWNILYEYACAFENEQQGNPDMMIYYLTDVSINIGSDYNGVMASEIRQTLGQYKEEIAQEKQTRQQLRNSEVSLLRKLA